ncbi:hypothetical protein CPT03_07155 [Pedobacter ginsengisoli]|uniref:Uncharacterized protein n=1 Tax=Pedobacter ginsengisoli TaxID=363852 RepID=A0A2D1U3T0_9SPHI|nr:hypothetical protein [Pedobacter ginsengisoli]ATP56263.1 hypothetical protein CPT03_07155 [Pedobacter ginsengisoli]
MKIRRFFLAGTFLLALFASVGFKPVKMAQSYCSWFYNGDCLDLGQTDQHDCYSVFTGPQCTITLGVLGVKPAYDRLFNQSCLYPLRQP